MGRTHRNEGGKKPKNFKPGRNRLEPDDDWRQAIPGANVRLPSQKPLETDPEDMDEGEEKIT